MKVFKLCIILIAYLLIGVLEVYSYYLFKNDAIGIFTFFTLLGFIMTFGIVVFKYGAFCLLAKNGRDFCVALKSLLTNKEWLTRFKVAGNKYDKKIVNY